MRLHALQPDTAHTLKRFVQLQQQRTALTEAELREFHKAARQTVVGACGQDLVRLEERLQVGAAALHCSRRLCVVAPHLLVALRGWRSGCWWALQRCIAAGVCLWWRRICLWPCAAGGAAAGGRCSAALQQAVVCGGLRALVALCGCRWTRCMSMSQHAQECLMGEASRLNLT